MTQKTLIESKEAKLVPSMLFMLNNTISAALKCEKIRLIMFSIN